MPSPYKALGGRATGGSATGGATNADAQRRRRAWLCGAALALGLSIAVGCRPQGSSSPPLRMRGADNAGSSSEMLNNAIGVLRGMDESSTPETLNSALARLNQWVASQPPLPDWKPDPLVESLPAELQQLPALATLAELQFPTIDGPLPPLFVCDELQEVVWLHEISEQAAGPESDPLARATRLFDWTVRNIQLEAPGKATAPHVPADILLLGRGQASDRAWVFMLLARQQGLDVVMLAKPQDATTTAGELLPALLLDGELYLFDPALGLPIPGPGGQGVATLRQVADDDGLLRHMDLDAEHPYSLKSSDFQQVVALVEASPIYLARRTRLVESALAGKQQLAISVQPSKLAERMKTAAHVQEVRLWPLPYERFRRRVDPDLATLRAWESAMQPFQQPTPILRKARVRHLLGKNTGTEGAIAMYQHARPSQREMQAMLDDPRVQQNRAQVVALVALLTTSKEDASYWLGLVAFERGDYDTAIDYFQKRTLDASPKGPWTAGARYNLGRSYEAQGKSAEAVRQYEAGQSPQRPGNLLRARWLKERATATP